MQQIKTRLLAAALLATLAAPATAAAAGLPGGASSLNETYQDWLVACGVREDTARCAMAQTQADAKSRQRVLAVELQATEEDDLAGRLLLPFGLALQQGVRLQVDEGSEKALGFSTCLPVGCIVPLAFDEAMIRALRGGSTLTVTAAASDTGQPVAFTVSLKGFSAAFARIVELTH